MKIKNLIAVCFSHGDETVHHWKTFADGTSGCLIEFDAEKLLNAIKDTPGLKHGKIIYKKLAEIEKKDIEIEIAKMPFTKRWPYRCEEEYRILVEHQPTNFVKFEFASISKTLQSTRRYAQQLTNFIAFQPLFLFADFM